MNNNNNMLHIEFDQLKNKDFKDEANNIWTCIGYGQNPDGSNYLVGKTYDAQRNDTIFRTTLLKKAVFTGQI